MKCKKCGIEYSNQSIIVVNPDVCPSCGSVEIEPEQKYMNTYLRVKCLICDWESDWYPLHEYDLPRLHEEIAGKHFHENHPKKLRRILRYIKSTSEIRL